MEADEKTEAEFHSGFVALVGRPNAGKSTLLNTICGHKVAIVSPVAQTTRRRLRAIINRPQSQLVIIDTPGLHKPKDALGIQLNRSALGALADVDIAVMLVDAASPVGRGDAWVAQHIAACEAPYKLLVITKSDLVSPPTIASQLSSACALAKFDDALVLSAKKGTNVESFIETISSHLPAGPHWFPQEMDTDASDEDLVCEYVREKAFRKLRQELPHSIAVICTDIVWSKGHASVRATILVERESQKGIVIGHRGSMIRSIGIEARRDLERLFGCGVYLDLSVRVQAAWRRDQQVIRRLGLEADA